MRRLICLIDQAAHFKINLTRCLFAEVTVLCDLAAEEDLLFLLSEGKRTEAAHAILAHHAASEVSCRFNVAPRAGRHLVEEDLLSHASTVGCRQAGFQILAGVVVGVVRKIDGDNESPSPGGC